MQETRDVGLIPEWEDPPGGGQGSLLQHSCLENPMDRGARRATVQSCKESDTTERLSTHSRQNKGFRELMRLNNQIRKWPGEWVDGVPAKERSVQDFTPGFAATGHWQYQIPLLSWMIFPSLPCIFGTPSQESKVGGIKWLAKWVPFLSKSRKREVLASSATENGTLPPTSPNTMKYSSQ